MYPDASSRLPRRRSWRVHIAWLAIVVVAFCGGVTLGFRAYAATLGQISLLNERAGYFGEIRQAARLVGKDDMDTYRRSADYRLRSNLVQLAASIRYVACTPNEMATLADARSYLAIHPYTGNDLLAEAYPKALASCDGPPATYPYTLFFF